MKHFYLNNLSFHFLKKSFIFLIGNSLVSFTTWSTGTGNMAFIGTPISHHFASYGYRKNNLFRKEEDPETRTLDPIQGVAVCRVSRPHSAVGKWGKLSSRISIAP